MRNKRMLRNLSPLGRRLGLVGMLAAMGTVIASWSVVPVEASSHREAPLIAQDPLADGTDVYAFVSPDDPTRTTIVANYVPFQAPAGGPNFYKFADDVNYDIHIDNVGDAKDHIVYRYTFQTTTVNANTFLYTTGPITFSGGAYQNWNRPQKYTLSRSTDGGATFTALAGNLLTPPVAVGPASTPNYHALAAAAVATNVGGSGITSFAGQRDDPFFADLARIFDLLSVNPAGGTDYLAGLNVNSLVLSIPNSQLEGPNHDHIIGVWSTASRFSTTVLAPGTKTGSGPQVQVSRLGNPLVNEVVIPLGKKDTFNGSQPQGDAQFASFVLTPELAALLKALNIDANAPTTGRTDLATVFLSGVPGLNQPAGLTAATVSEQLRLNFSIPPSTTNPNTVNRMGVLGGQLDGFPNGRRLADDVTDIAIQAVDGILCQPGGALTGATTVFGPIAQCRPNAVPAALGDGVNKNDVAFQCTFPYVADPWPAYGSRPVDTSCNVVQATPTPTPAGLAPTGGRALSAGWEPIGAFLAVLLVGGSLPFLIGGLLRRRNR